MDNVKEFDEDIEKERDSLKGTENLVEQFRNCFKGYKNKSNNTLICCGRR